VAVAGNSIQIKLIILEVLLPPLSVFNQPSVLELLQVWLARHPKTEPMEQELKLILQTKYSSYHLTNSGKGWLVRGLTFNGVFNTA